MFLTKINENGIVFFKDSLSFNTFLEFCSFLSSFYNGKFKLIFEETINGNITPYFFNNENKIDFFKELENNYPEIFSQYISKLNGIPLEKFPDLQTAWFYSQLKNTDIPLVSVFKNGKLNTFPVNIEKSKYHNSFFEYAFFVKNKECIQNNLNDLQKTICFMRGAFDCSFISIDEDKIKKGISKYFRIGRFQKDFENTTSNIIRYILKKHSEEWLLFLYKNGFDFFINKHIFNIIDLEKILIFKNLLNEKDFLLKNESLNILHYCVNNEKYEFVEAFLEKFPFKINEKINNGLTPLMYSCLKCDKKMIDILLKYDADVSIENDNGVLASELIPDFDFSDNLFFYLEDIRKKNKER